MTASGPTCSVCGQLIPEDARFCGGCGAASVNVSPDVFVAAPAPPPRLAPTGTPQAFPAGPLPMAGGSRTLLQGASPLAAPLPVPPDHAVPRAPGSAKTMVGVVPGGFDAPPPPPLVPAAAAPSPSAPGRLPNAQRTMMGVLATPFAGVGAPAVPLPAAPSEPKNRTMLGLSFPGIVPERPEAGAAQPLTAAPHDASTVGPTGGRGRTAIGVAPAADLAAALPGSPQTEAFPAADYPPPVPPFPGAPYAGTADDPGTPRDANAPEAPAPPRGGGVHVGIVAALVGGLLVLGGGTIALLYRGGAPLTGQPRVDAQGAEAIHLRCGNCKDGTTATLEGAVATFQGGEADVPLAHALAVGNNPLAIQIDRPAPGRDETVTLNVPVAFRIRADASGVTASPPVLLVKVAAVAGTVVVVDGKPLPLDATGNATYALDLSAEVSAAAEDVRALDRQVPYSITAAGRPPETGVLGTRVLVTPLHLNSPSHHAVTDQRTFVVSGQTQPGGSASVKVGDVAATVESDGTFGATLETPTKGDQTFDVQATAPGRAPRTGHVSIKRVASLAAEAKALEAQKPLTYDAAMANLERATGQLVVLAGEVMEIRDTAHERVAIFDDRRGCAKGPCVARVVALESAKLSRGEALRIYGHVVRGVTANGATVPEVEADVIVKGSRH